jgi:hypothetical protein
MRRKTPNTERPTPNAQPKAFRVNEANSESAAPKKTNYDLEDRLLEFAVAVVELTDDLPNTRAGNHIAGQHLRCGTSPYGPSWLVSWLRKMNRDPRLVACLAEAEELIRIFVASVRTTERGRNT